MTECEKIFNRIYDATYRKTLIYVTAKCSSMQDIEDIMQEIYSELYSVLMKKGESYLINPAAFVLRIAKSKVYRHYSLGERIRGLSLNTEDAAEREYIDSLADEVDVRELVCDKLLLEEISAQLHSMPTEVQKVFRLYYGLDLSIAEIAEELGVGESWVKNKLYRTLKEFRKLYGGDNK